MSHFTSADVNFKLCILELPKWCIKSLASTSNISTLSCSTLFIHFLNFLIVRSRNCNSARMAVTLLHFFKRYLKFESTCLLLVPRKLVEIKYLQFCRLLKIRFLNYFVIRYSSFFNCVVRFESREFNFPRASSKDFSLSNNVFSNCLVWIMSSSSDIPVIELSQLLTKFLFILWKCWGLWISQLLVRENMSWSSPLSFTMS